MKRKTALFVIMFFGIGLSASMRASAESAFEGSIILKTTMGTMPPVNMTYFFKGNKLRIESSRGGRNSVAIVDKDSNTLTQLMTEQKSFMKRPLPNPKSMPAPPADVNDKPVKTGKTEMILGYNCEEWTMTNAQKLTTDLWCAHDVMQTPFQLGQMGRGTPQSKLDDLYKQVGFPLRLVVTDSAGKEQMRTEAVKVEKKTLDASLFVPPDDYKAMAMPPGRMRPQMGMPPGGAPPMGGPNSH